MSSDPMAALRLPTMLRAPATTPAARARTTTSGALKARNMPEMSTPSPSGTNSRDATESIYRAARPHDRDPLRERDSEIYAIERVHLISRVLADVFKLNDCSDGAWRYDWRCLRRWIVRLRIRFVRRWALIRESTHIPVRSRSTPTPRVLFLPLYEIQRIHRALPPL